MQRKDLDPYTSPRAFYGAELRRLREAAGLSQVQLGEHAFCSDSYIAHFESGTRRPQEEASKLFDETLGSGEHLQRLCELARRTKLAEYFADAAELEKRALTISEYAPTLVPGLLQTETYARTVTRASLPFVPHDRVEGYVRTRIDRQGLLTDPARPHVWAILHETVLRVLTGGPDVMREQLLHISELAMTRQIVVQVLTFTGAAEASMSSMSSIMTFRDEPPVVYAEALIPDTSSTIPRWSSDTRSHTISSGPPRCRRRRPWP